MSLKNSILALLCKFYSWADGSTLSNAISAAVDMIFRFEFAITHYSNYIWCCQASLNSYSNIYWLNSVYWNRLKEVIVRGQGSADFKRKTSQLFSLSIIGIYIKQSQVWCYAPVLPATRDTETGGPLEFKDWKQPGLQWRLISKTRHDDTPVIPAIGGWGRRFRNSRTPLATQRVWGSFDFLSQTNNKKKYLIWKYHHDTGNEKLVVQKNNMLSFV